ncbi:MAG: ubiquinol-cytochrome-c reductase complex assembly factor 3 [Proteobacteria bacterium]|nr:ubiquinol-cytochrome-c reductase complex assembly factor 3 [Pseudomonadota bacterium]
MMFLLRVLLVIAVLVGIAYGALYALGALVEPEQREITHILPNPKREAP